MRKTFLRLGSGIALLAVALGAFGSHGLREVLSPEHFENYEIGVRYQFYHSLAVIAVGVLSYFGKKAYLRYAGWLFFGGIVLFSGSLYLLSIRDIFPVPVNVVGPLTPVGGLMFIGGWGLLFLSTFQHHESSKKEA